MTQSKTSYIPLDEVVAIYRLSKQNLLGRIKTGQLSSLQLPDGTILVAEQELDPSLNIQRDDFEALNGKQIGVREGANKYNLTSIATISGWIKVGHIRVLNVPAKRGQKK